MNVTLGFSPCPNDTFIFDALVNKKIPTGDFEFDVRLEDVETLNTLALAGSLDITKVSYGVLSQILDNYVVLNSGSALGSGVGPLVIAKNYISYDKVKDCHVAIPGQHTTAHKLFMAAFPGALHKTFLRYDEIENFIINGGADHIGVIIHENRFTYEKKGLIKLIDLGDFWEKETGSMIPLGGIVAKRIISTEILLQINELIKKSIQFAFENYPLITPYVREHSQEMQEAVMRKHIDLYVNKYSIELGQTGKQVIKKMLSTEIAILPEQIFIS
ncbi:1,4-dihydroxy-6-naphthoate synthase [soil metagenome]